MPHFDSIRFFAARLAGVVLAMCQTVADCSTREAVQFDLSKGTPFLGLGLEVWRGGMPPQTSQFIASLGATALRASFFPDTAWPQRSLSVQEFVGLMLRLPRLSESQSAQKLADLMKQRNLKFHFVSWGFPKPWLKQPDDPKTHRPNMNFAQNYANVIVARILWLKRLGAKPDYIEITNEPQGGWNTLMSPAEYEQVLVDVHQALVDNKLTDVGIEGPGTDPESIDRFLTPLIVDGNIRNLSALSVHVYDRSPDITAAATFFDAGKYRDLKMPVFVTEYNNTSPAWSTGFFRRRPSYVDDPIAHASPNFAVSSLADAVALISSGSSQVFYWQLADFPWDQGSLGLIDRDGRAKPIAAAMAMVFSQLRDAVIATKHTPTRFPSMCASSAVGRSCTIVNLERDPLAIRLELKGLLRCEASARTFDGLAAGEEALSNEVKVPTSAQQRKGLCSLDVLVKPRSITQISFQ